jgi:hypothetical protein
MLRSGTTTFALAAVAATVAGCLVTIDENKIPGGGGGAGAEGAQGGGGSSGQGGAGGGELPGTARILFSDLEGGPTTGGQDDQGAFVTIWGRGFGAQQGASFVTIGGGRAAAYPVWSDSKITFQLGSKAATGDIVVHVAGDGLSNGLAFTVRDGALYFVDELGDDLGPGTFESPFEHVPHCVGALAPGGICYVRDGVVQALDADGAALVLPPSAQPVAPKAVIGYPGEMPRLVSSGDKGLLACNDPAGCADDGHWVFAGFRVEAPARAVAAAEVQGLRVVGNHLVCSSSAVEGPCVEITASAHDIAVLGNVAIVPTAPMSAEVSIVEIGDSVRNVEVGYNALKGPAAFRGIHAVDGPGVMSLYGNLITDVAFRGIDLAWFTFDPGPSTVINNVVARVDDGTGESACIGVGYGGGVGVVDVVHNTMFDCGRTMGACLYTGAPVSARNNIFAQPEDTAFVKMPGFPASATGDTNLFWGTDTGSIPSFFTGNVIGDPAFRAPETDDFHLLDASDAIDAGSEQNVPLDRDGRPRQAAPDIGAYEAQSPGG